MTPYMFF